MFLNNEINYDYFVTKTNSEYYLKFEHFPYNLSQNFVLYKKTQLPVQYYSTNIHHRFLIQRVKIRIINFHHRYRLHF